MIRIKVYGPFGLYSKNIDSRGWIELKDHSTLKDALKHIEMPAVLAKFFLVRVNAVEVPLNRELHDGDVIGFISAITGG